MARQAVAAKLASMEIEDFRRRQAEIIKLEDEARAKNKALMSDIEDYRRLILNGEAKTGDPITDYFIAAHRDISPESSKPLRNIEERMCGRKGELFLVVRREKKEYSFSDPGYRVGGARSYVETQYYLGLLTEEELVLEPRKLSFGFPTEWYANMSVRPIEKNQGPFVLSVPRGLHELDQSFCVGDDAIAAFEILIGDVEVFSYAPREFHPKLGRRPSSWVAVLNETARMVGKSVPEAPEEITAREEEKKKTLGMLEGAVYALRQTRNQDPLVPREVDECADGLKKILVRAKELGLEEEGGVQLAEAELNVAART